jgi:hypothetical protein
MFKGIFSNSTITNSVIGGSSICMSGNKVTINGKTIQVPNGNVSIINNKVFVNGKEIDTSDTDLKSNCGTINISVEGNVDKIDCNGSVKVKGNVSKGIDCGGSVEITGDVDGLIDCGGSVKITGSHKGDIDAGGSVSVR